MQLTFSLIILSATGFFSVWKIVDIMFFSRKLPLPAKQVSEAEKLFKSRIFEGDIEAKRKLELYFKEVSRQIRYLAAFSVYLSAISLFFFRFLSLNGREFWGSVASSPACLAAIGLLFFAFFSMILFMWLDSRRLRKDILERFNA